MKLELRELDLALRHPFTIAHGTITTQHNLLVALHDGTAVGFGEAPGSRAWPQYRVEAMRAALDQVRGTIESAEFRTPDEFWRQVQPAFSDNPFALCALDEAVHDLWGRRLGQPVWQLWGLRLEGLPLTSYTIGLDTIEMMVAKMREFDGWPIYKIKLGTPDDLAIVRALRKQTDAIFRIDANTAWTVEQTLALAPELKALGVEFIEQPLQRDDWTGMARVHAECALPVMADESCQNEADLERCADHFSGINIKLSKAGGLTPARRMIKRARELGLRVMAGCMCESSVGISAVAQLAPLLDYADFDGALLLAEDVADGVRIERGRLILPERAGTGVQLRGASNTR
jgi:L-alanine-DL-glutamate epimerase-like enolase superfamily enzyme